MNIVLVGFMGAGKTTVGRILAARLGYRFLDTDLRIEREQGRKVEEIFATFGQEYFRRLETDLLKRLTAVQNMVVATGGGILTTPENANLIRKIGTSVYLEVRVEKLFERATRTDKRPLLKTENPFETMMELFQKRKELYETADIRIKTEDWDRHPMFVAKEIINNL